jgi:recombinational DNA repair ATPase RecF
MNLITGDNAQGKTNLLESMVCLSLTRPHRLNSDQSLIRNGTDYAEIGCIFEDGTDKRIDILIHPEPAGHHEPETKAAQYEIAKKQEKMDVSN